MLVREKTKTPAIARERERAVGAIIDNGLSAPIPCGNVAMSMLAAPMMAYRHRVLHRGHAAYIVVESVEKPTDRGSRSLLCLPHG
jgi:hypothetical protein